jgi:hypothetical protein
MPVYEFVVVTKQYRTVAIEAESVNDGYDKIGDDFNSILQTEPFDNDSDVYFEREINED